MKVIRETSDFYIERPTAVCIGKFDGVHRGHRKLLEKIVAKKQEGLLATVFTFNPSPAELFTGRKEIELCSTVEKESYLEELGIDIIIEFPLTFESAAMKPEAFVKDILIDKLSMKYIAAGPDLSFGDKGAGDWNLIERLAKQYNFEYDVIEKVKADGKDISSSRIKKAMETGSVEEAYRMLGRIK